MDPTLITAIITAVVGAVLGWLAKRNQQPSPTPGPNSPPATPDRPILEAILKALTRLPGIQRFEASPTAAEYAPAEYQAAVVPVSLDLGNYLFIQDQGGIRIVPKPASSTPAS